MNWIANLIGQLSNTPLHFQLRRLRWIVIPAVLILAAIHQFAIYLVADAFPVTWQWWVQLLIYTLTGSIVAWLGLTWIADAAAQRYDTESQLRRAYAELEENHNQLYALHNLGERITDADDQHTILEIAARAPLELTTARASTVITFDAVHDRLKLDMAWGLSENYLKALRNQLEIGISSERCQHCSSLKTHFESDCPLFRGLQSTAHAEGINSLICMPVTHDEERIGIISAYFPSADGPPEDQIRLLNILGGVIATAMENFRSRARELQTVHALDQATNQSFMVDKSTAVDQISSQVLNIAASGWDAQVGGVMLWNEETQSWDCRTSLGFEVASDDPCYKIALELARQAQKNNQPIIRSNVENGRSKLRSMAAAPLISEGKTLGVLFLGAHRGRAINENQAELLNTVAHQIALAIRNAQLYSQLGQMAILKERYRLSREFHDGLAQTLGYLGFQAERVENLVAEERNSDASSEINELRQTIRAAYIDVREAIDGLRLSVEDPGQVASRLAEYTAAFSRQTGISMEFMATPDNLEIDPSMALQILRIAQEALTNVRKHAQARNVKVLLQKELDSVQMVITDDGRGFPTEIQSERTHHRYGLTTMRERAEEQGGTLTIATSPKQGTRITVHIPIEILELAHK
jgi:nitrate/nitrite-specific signal transduction histidine kinase